MKKVVSLIVLIAVAAAGLYMFIGGMSGMMGNDKGAVDTTIETKTLLNPGEVFEKGNYILADGVEILYNGKSFLVTNNRTDMVRVLYSIVGVKKDGTYDVIQLSGLSGVDKTQYERDKTENGWAIEKLTNLVRPGETLEAEFEAFDFNSADSEYPKNDIDEDGYLDIVFTVCPQIDETTVKTSTNDYKSEVYKIKAEQ